MALSALHLVHGLDPSHLDFFRRQRSHALHTLFRRLSVMSCEAVLAGADMTEGLNVNGVSREVKWG